jgi:hypothetical protein
MTENQFALTETQRRAVYNMALEARRLLLREIRELLEGHYGLHADGTLEPPEQLPIVQEDPEAAETHDRLVRYLQVEAERGVLPEQAAAQLVKETAFTWLNRLAAFKMMEVLIPVGERRALIRQTVSRGTESNAFRHYVADPAHEQDYQRYQAGEVDVAYRNFILWQCAQVAREVKVLFDPDTLPSRLFPRPQALRDLLALLNDKALDGAWQAPETIGWIYQFFNEPEKAQVFERLYKKKQKLRSQDIPAATQLFTPNWIVRFLMQNTLGRLWVQMHPDTRLVGTDLLNYLVPLAGEVPPEPLRPIREITLLDPACGTMHFGLVAFDLLVAMYQEELERAGEPGWPETPSVSNLTDIPTAIIQYNLFGIDIDLRAVQLSALTLYLKTKSLNKEAKITDSNLAVAGVRPLDGRRLERFLDTLGEYRPIFERVLRALWRRLEDAEQLGSLLRLERDIAELVAEERARYARAPLFAGLAGEFEREAAEDEFWAILEGQVIQALNHFAREAAALGQDQTFFAGEAIKGLRLLDLMLRRYDVVVTNPPYSGKRNLNDTIADYLNSDYPNAKGDLYTAFIQRCGELVTENGRLGMITQQSFMFLSSYEKLRADLRRTFAIETMAHTGPRTFAEISGEKVNTTLFVLRAEMDTPRRESNIGTYFRLVNAPEGDGKRQAFEQALQDGSNIYCVTQHHFNAILAAPWVYWIPDGLRHLFVTLPNLGEIGSPKHGRYTGDNSRFLRFWWEVRKHRIKFGAHSGVEVNNTACPWVPYMKGGTYRKWYGNQDFVTLWLNDGMEQKAFPRSGERNPDYYFREGLTWTDLGSKGFTVRLNPGGFLFDVSGPCAFPERPEDFSIVLGALNSPVTNFLLNILNPTIHFQIGDLARLPMPRRQSQKIQVWTRQAVQLQFANLIGDEVIFDFIAPPRWDTGLEDLTAVQVYLANLERQIDDEVYRLYGISDEDRLAIERELAGGSLAEGDKEQDATTEAPITQRELAVRWASHAVGVAMGRFRPGAPGELGSAVFRREDFAVGSLPAPDVAEFDRLVGPAERFAYVDEQGGRHLFPAQVEEQLRALALPEGVAVLDRGHSHDLAQRVSEALRLMWGDEGLAEISDSLGSDLRRFLAQDFWPKWHFKWYRYRPIYWLLQSPGGGYSLYLYHERVTRDTLFAVQRSPYLEARRRGVELALGDKYEKLKQAQGRQKRELQKAIEGAEHLLQDLETFAQRLKRITDQGYEPNLDDGVLLNLAPLHTVVPWPRRAKYEGRRMNELEATWHKLEAGEYDWAHLALRHWPERVQEKCQGDKSLAIAHKHVEWYQGD